MSKAAGDEPNREFVATSRRRKKRSVGQTVEASCSERMSEIRVPLLAPRFRRNSMQGSLSVGKRRAGKALPHAGVKGLGAPKGNQTP